MENERLTPELIQARDILENIALRFGYTKCNFIMYDPVHIINDKQEFSRVITVAHSNKDINNLGKIMFDALLRLAERGFIDINDLPK